MTAIDRLDAWLRISPSTVLPAEVLEYLDDVKAENEKLRELAQELYADQCDECDCWKYRDRMRDLGIEVDG